MKQTIAICAGVLAGALAFGLVGAEPAKAQPVYPGYPFYPGYAVMPPQEVVAIVRSIGLKPLTPPMRHGPFYALRALDPAGQEVRVVVNGRNGRVKAVQPIFGPRYAVVPPRHGGPPGQIPLAGDDGYGPNPRIAGLPPGTDGPPGYGPGYGPGVRPGYGPGAGPAYGPGPGPGYGPGAGPDGPPPPGRAPAALAPAPSVQAGPPPLPRPRPKVAAVDTSPVKPADAAPATAPQPGPATVMPPKDDVVTGTVTAPPSASPVPEEIHE